MKIRRSRNFPGILSDFSGSFFPTFSPLELEIRHFGPEIQILCEISSLELDGHVWKLIWVAFKALLDDVKGF